METKQKTIFSCRGGGTRETGYWCNSLGRYVSHKYCIERCKKGKKIVEDAKQPTLRRYM